MKETQRVLTGPSMGSPKISSLLHKSWFDSECRRAKNSLNDNYPLHRSDPKAYSVIDLKHPKSQYKLLIKSKKQESIKALVGRYLEGGETEELDPILETGIYIIR